MVQVGAYQQVAGYYNNTVDKNERKYNCPKRKQHCEKINRC